MRIRTVAFCRLADALGVKLTRAQLARLDALENEDRAPAKVSA